ncbi:hypothetical protein SprV_0602132900 [Sparganum proliferum]
MRSVSILSLVLTICSISSIDAAPIAGLPTATSDASPTTSMAPATDLVTTTTDASPSTSKAPAASATTTDATPTTTMSPESTVPSMHTNETQTTNSTEQGCAIGNDTRANDNEVTLYTVQTIFTFYADMVLALIWNRSI